MDSVSAIILNWRTPQHALAAREALLGDGVPAERILMVDNGSDDDSVDAFTTLAGDSPALVLAENLGFARANNRGAARLPAGRCLLFVNGDAFLRVPGSVAALVAAVARPEVGLAVPRMRSPDLSLQRTVVPLAAPWPELVRASGLSRLIPNRWQPQLGTHWDHGRSRRIQAADGPVLAVDARAFADAGGFAEQTFMYGEDHDLCRRIAGLGLQVHFVAEAEFVHVGAAASRQRWDDAERAERIARAEGALLLQACSGSSPAWIAVGAAMLGAGARARFWRRRGDPRAEVQSATWRGYRAAARAQVHARRRDRLK